MRPEERIRQAAAQVRAPDALRASVEAAAAGPAPRSRRLVPAFAAVAAVALVAVSLAFLLGGGGSRPALDRGVEAALGDPMGAAQAREQIDGLGFPPAAYEGRLRASGRRVDTIAGRRALTVAYGRGASRVGYTIVSTPALEVPKDARRVTRGGIRFAVVERGTATAVVWERDGHTCILAARGTNARRLLDFLPA